MPKKTSHATSGVPYRHRINDDGQPVELRLRREPGRIDYRTYGGPVAPFQHYTEGINNNIVVPMVPNTPKPKDKSKSHFFGNLPPSHGAIQAKLAHDARVHHSHYQNKRNQEENKKDRIARRSQKKKAHGLNAAQRLRNALEANNAFVPVFAENPENALRVLTPDEAMYLHKVRHGKNIRNLEEFQENPRGSMNRDRVLDRRG